MHHRARRSRPTTTPRQPRHVTADRSAVELVGVDAHRERTLALDGKTSPTATIADVAFVQGTWSGEALGGFCEEVWSAPAGGAMLGMFRLVVEDEPKFYELLTIREEGPSLVLQLKHFDAKLIGWEEKDDTVSFPLVKVEDQRAYFKEKTAGIEAAVLEEVNGRGVDAAAALEYLKSQIK